jgi:hypothetical protein
VVEADRAVSLVEEGVDLAVWEVEWLLEEVVVLERLAEEGAASWLV